MRRTANTGFAKIISIRIDLADWADLEKQAAAQGISKPEAIRRAIGH